MILLQQSQSVFTLTLKGALYTEASLAQDLMLVDIATTVEMSPHYFASLFKQSTGLAPHQYILKQRIEQAKQLLANRALPITNVLLQVGFKSQSHFTRVFRQHTGTTPKAYRDLL